MYLVLASSIQSEGNHSFGNKISKFYSKDYKLLKGKKKEWRRE